MLRKDHPSFPRALTVVRCGLSSKTRGYPFHLIFWGAVNNWIMTKARIHFALGVSASSADALNNFYVLSSCATSDIRKAACPACLAKT
jgi:hypothetical protein